jgi:hypothetical protein
MCLDQTFLGLRFGRYFKQTHIATLGSAYIKSYSAPEIRVARWFVFQTKNPNLGKFWGALQWKFLAYVKTIWSILRPLEIFYGHLVYIVTIRYSIPNLVNCIKKNLATLPEINSLRKMHSTDSFR